MRRTHILYYAMAYPLRDVWKFFRCGELCPGRMPVKTEPPGHERVAVRHPFCTGEYNKLEQQLREQQSKEPLNLSVQGKLLQVLTAAGLEAGAQQAHEAYAQEVAEKDPGDPGQLVLQSQKSDGIPQARHERTISQQRQFKAARLNRPRSVYSQHRAGQCRRRRRRLWLRAAAIRRKSRPC